MGCGLHEGSDADAGRCLEYAGRARAGMFLVDGPLHVRASRCFGRGAPSGGARGAAPADSWWESTPWEAGTGYDGNGGLGGRDGRRPAGRGSSWWAQRESAGRLRPEGVRAAMTRRGGLRWCRYRPSRAKALPMIGCSASKTSCGRDSPRGGGGRARPGKVLARPSWGLGRDDVCKAPFGGTWWGGPDGPSRSRPHGRAGSAGAYEAPRGDGRDGDRRTWKASR